jgi:two-component system cell cycle response regulator
MDRQQSEPRAVRLIGAMIVLGVAIHGSHALLHYGGSTINGIIEDWVYTAVEVLAVGLCAARVIQRREDRAAWTLMCVGLLTWTIGDLIWTVWLEHLANPPIPSIADGFYLAMYPAIYASLMLLIRSRTRGASASQWLDGAVVGLTLAAAGAQLVLPTLLASRSHHTLEDAVNLAYPLGDLTLLVFVILAFSLSGWRPGRAWSLIGAGLVASAVADLLFVYLNANGRYTSGGIIETIWPLSMGLIAYSAWKPTRGPRGRITGDMIMLPWIATAAAMALLVDGAWHHVTPVAIACARAAVLLSFARSALTYRANLRVLRAIGDQAITDPLTGLGNRRALMEDLDAAAARSAHGEATTLAFLDLDGFKRYNDTFGHSAGDTLLARVGLALAAAVGTDGSAYRLGGDEFCVLVGGRISRRHPLIEDAVAALTERGSAFTVSPSFGLAVLPDDAGSASAALQLADRRMYADKDDGEQRHHRGETRDVLMQLLSERTPGAHGSIYEVGRRAGNLGRHLELDAEQLDELLRAAELHDIGKLAIPDEILFKPGALTASEWQFMRQHPLIGERILNADPALRPVARLVRASHERWDGTGYPDALAGEAIPLAARILAVCDAFEAMRRNRIHQRARTDAEAIEELRRQSGRQFDPVVVEALDRQLETELSSAIKATLK